MAGQPKPIAPTGMAGNHSHSHWTQIVQRIQSNGPDTICGLKRQRQWHVRRAITFFFFSLNYDYFGSGLDVSLAAKRFLFNKSADDPRASWVVHISHWHRQCRRCTNTFNFGIYSCWRWRADPNTISWDCTRPVSTYESALRSFWRWLITAKCNKIYGQVGLTVKRNDIDGGRMTLFLSTKWPTKRKKKKSQTHNNGRTTPQTHI